MKALKSQKSAYPCARTSAHHLTALSPLMVLILAACGGGTSSTEPTALAPVVVAPPVVTPPVVTPPLRVTAFCESTPKETLGADDPFYVNSWHLKNTGPTQAVSASNNVGLAGIDANTETAHNGGLGCTGKGIVIAINDSGLELTHEDIAPNLVAGKSFNFNTLTDDPSPPIPQLTTDHGTGVAGVAIARGWNGKGSRGTAPFASVVGYVSANESSPEISYLAYGGRSKAGASALVTQFGNRTDGVDIFNFSAGADFADVAAFEDDDALDSQTDAARVGTQTLRAGKGAVYFQSAGIRMWNTAAHAVAAARHWPSIVRRP